MKLKVNNLFNNKDVILSREDVFKVAKYAIENKIVDVIWFEGEFDYTSLQSDDNIEIDNIVMLDIIEVEENE